jgi:CxxC-x17-CxxC domain-containing protein
VVAADLAAAVVVEAAAHRSFGGGGGGGGGGGPRPPRQMFAVTCAACGKETEVPFKPRGDRPVYCNDCFRKNG